MGSTCRDISELTPLAQEACRLFLKECEKRGIDIFITETYRSQERQNELWEQGRTKPGNIVTWTLNSRHTGRKAWDIACKGGVLYNAGILYMAGAVGKELGITWGGDWATPDRPHFEITGSWRSPKEEEEVTQEQFNKMMETYIAERNKLSASSWAEEDLKEAEEAGITDGSYPQAFATREQVASMIVRALK